MEGSGELGSPPVYAALHSPRLLPSCLRLQCQSTLTYLESLRLGRAARKRLYEYTLVYP